MKVIQGASKAETAVDKRGHKGESGLTLIEVLLALAIFSIGVLAVAQLQISTVRNTTRANVITMANMLAQSRMDELKNFSSLIELDALDGVEENDIDEFGNSGGVFTRTTSVDTPPNPIGTLAREITVRVTWDSAWRGHRQVEMTSLTQGNGI
ncbi:MAG: prepilin-type N-terminal cleavage/methylation domain-containing protein [Desulfobacterales bacterium]